MTRSLVIVNTSFLDLRFVNTYYFRLMDIALHTSINLCTTYGHVVA